ncbi:MAG: HAMP domain-containing histidine kinase [Roseburia sp.]|nr:HAMP domain-containing histidine kinase [Ruminococcus sp.]MCM1156673.1 HAMP domain-containing histidine kinase [Roseburia sp.]MCM1243095.1 HAMP domain-containing histidine kinase [Roseburia sp.]
MDRVGELKWFFIKRFFICMLFIFISEELFTIVYRRWLVFFLADTLHISQLSFVSDEGSMMALMLQMFLFSAARFLPEGISGWVQNLISQNMGNGLHLDIASPVLEGVNDQKFVSLYQIAVIFVFLGLFFVTLLPYLIAAYWYYRGVSGRVKDLLQKEKEQKEAYDRQRNLLLSDIAHDIKTPLTTVCGYASALVDDVVEEEDRKKEYLRAIYAKSMRMNKLMSLLFEYVKLDSEGFALHTEQADLGEFLRENIALLYADFEEKKMELEIAIPEGRFLCKIDRVQLSRALTNILTNAVRYNPEGCKVLAGLQDNGNGQLQIRIADSGTLIEDKLAARIFEPFARGDAARRADGGNGLGLSISAKIIQMHGGTLTLERQCPDGYVKAFVVTLPLLQNLKRADIL